MLDWYAARMMAGLGDLEEAGYVIADTFPSEQFSEYDHLVHAHVLARAGLRCPQTRYPCAYADGTPQGMLNGWEREPSRCA